MLVLPWKRKMHWGALLSYWICLLNTILIPYHLAQYFTLSPNNLLIAANTYHLCTPSCLCWCNSIILLLAYDFPPVNLLLIDLLFIITYVYYSTFIVFAIAIKESFLPLRSFAIQIEFQVLLLICGHIMRKLSALTRKWLFSEVFLRAIIV